MRNDGPPWTEAEIEKLAKNWNAGKSAGELCDLLPGRSRVAILGKIKRLRENKVSPMKLDKRRMPSTFLPRMSNADGIDEFMS
jgi:hypothetical protein